MNTNSQRSRVQACPREVLKNCPHGWAKHYSAKPGDFVQCLGCRTSVRIIDVREVTPVSTDG